MRMLDLLEYALSDFANSKFKTFMSALGIIIGVMAIVAMLTLGDAITSYVSSANGDLDLDTIVIMPPATLGMTSAQFGMKGQSMTLTDRDLSPIAGISGVIRTSPRTETLVGATYRNENVTMAAIGILPQTEDRLAGYTDRGRFLVPADTNSVVVGSAVANQTFSKKIRPGDHITLTNPVTSKSSDYVVAGILKQVNSSVLSGNVNSAVLMTRPGLRMIADQNTISRIIVRVNDVSKEGDIAAKISKSLSRAHKNEAALIEPAADYYQGTAMIGDIIKYIMGGIGAISLLVGGIGIMNVMMLTVRERTKEIGLMKAIGATTGDIRMVFIVESLLLGLMGSLAGIAVAALAASTIGYLGHFTVGVSPENAIVGLAIGLGATLVFGVYPASQASKLDPIEALRTE